MTAALDRCEVPVLLLGGWQDLFLDQTITQYQHLRDRGIDVAMTIGPWTHSRDGYQGRRHRSRRDPDLAGRASGQAADAAAAEPGARIRHPPRLGEPAGLAAGHRRRRACTCSPAGRLGRRAATGRRARRRRSATTPRTRRRQWAAGCWPAPAATATTPRWRERADVLSFTSGPLDADLYVCGNPVVELAHEADNPHFDLFVRISEVDARGRSRNVSDGYRRFNASPDGPVRIELDAIASPVPRGIADPGARRRRVAPALRP